MNNCYPYLPEGKIIEYVKENNLFMVEAKLMRNNYSSDSNHPTGAVVVLNGKIVGRFANQSTIKNKKILDLHRNGLCVRKILRIPSGKAYWLCPGCASFRNHAESGAVKDALLRQKSIIGADIYLFGHWWCCKPCWDSMVKVGIAHVYLVEGATELFR